MHIQLAENMGQIEKDDLGIVDGRQQDYLQQQQQSGFMSENLNSFLMGF